MSHKSTTQMIYDRLAERYETDIVTHAFGQFAVAVLRTAAPQGHEHALDIGTGTGILARVLAPHVQTVIGIDLSPEMIAVGQGIPSPPNLTLQTADAEQLPFEDGQFNLVVSSFGLNATHPRKVLPEILRVLKSGGVLAFHEWNIMHPIDTVISDVLAKYMLDDDEVSEGLLHLREYMTAPHPWDNAFQTAEDYQDELTEYGFRDVQVWEDTPAEIVLSIPDMLRYKLAWTNRQLELAAMDEWRRGDCLDELRMSLQDYVDDNHHLHYAPLLFRVKAVS